MLVVLIIAAVVATVAGSSRLIGNLPVLAWVGLVALTALAAAPEALDRFRRAIDSVARASRVIAVVGGWIVFVLALYNVVTRYLDKYVERDILSGKVDSATWQMFAVMFLLAVNHGVLTEVNPRVDFWWAEFSLRRKAWLDFVLHLALLLPFTIMGLRLLWPFAQTSLGRKFDGTWPDGWQVWNSWEQSPDADTLPVGPVKSLLVVCFALWFLQILSETIKRGFILMGRIEYADQPETAEQPIRIE